MPSLATTCSRESVSFCRECGHAAIRESMPPKILLVAFKKLTASERVSIHSAEWRLEFLPLPPQLEQGQICRIPGPIRKRPTRRWPGK